MRAEILRNWSLQQYQQIVKQWTKWFDMELPYYFRFDAFCCWDVLVIQMKQKGCNGIFIFCFEIEQIKNVLQVPSQMMVAAVAAQQCRLYFILVLTGVAHCKTN